MAQMSNLAKKSKLFQERRGCGNNSPKNSGPMQTFCHTCNMQLIDYCLQGLKKKKKKGDNAFPKEDVRQLYSQEGSEER